MWNTLVSFDKHKISVAILAEKTILQLNKKKKHCQKLECTRYFLLRVLVVLTHTLVGVATIAASYPFLTAIIFWKGVTIEGSEVLLAYGMFMISTVDRLPSKGTLSSVHHCCQSLNKSPG